VIVTFVNISDNPSSNNGMSANPKKLAEATVIFTTSLSGSGYKSKFADLLKSEKQ